MRARRSRRHRSGRWRFRKDLARTDRQPPGGRTRGQAGLCGDPRDRRRRRPARNRAGRPPRPERRDSRSFRTSDWQPKGDRTYFKQTIKLRPGEIYVSPVDAGPDRPDDRHAARCRPCGWRRRFSRRTASCSASSSSMSTCGRLSTASARRRGRAKTSTSSMNSGDYLVHPDRAREFGSQLGKPSSWQSDFPVLAILARRHRKASRRSCRIRTDGPAASRWRRPSWPAMNGSR